MKYNRRYNGRRRIGYRKTYRKAGNYSRIKAYKSSRLRTAYRRYTKYNRYRRNGRQRTIQKSVQALSKILNTTSNMKIKPAIPSYIYNGSHISVGEVPKSTKNAIYQSLLSILPESFYNDTYQNTLSSDEQLKRPSAKLKNTDIIVESTETNPLALVSFHNPLLLTYAATRELASVLGGIEPLSSFIEDLPICILDNNGNSIIKLVKDSGDDQNLIIQSIRNKAAEFYKYYFACVVGYDTNQMYKACFFKVNNGYEIMFMDQWAQITSIDHIITEYAQLIGSVKGFNIDQIAQLKDMLSRNTTGNYRTNFNKLTRVEYPGIYAACMGLTQDQRKIFAEFLTMVNVTAGNIRSIINGHKSFSLEGTQKYILEDVLKTGIMSIRILKSESPRTFTYKPTKTPNGIILCALTTDIGVKIKQEYKLFAVNALMGVRKALHNNPDLTSTLSKPMVNFLLSTFPELKFYKEGQRAQDKLHRKGGRL
jgi:hypothetical protein